MNKKHVSDSTNFKMLHLAARAMHCWPNVRHKTSAVAGRQMTVQAGWCDSSVCVRCEEGCCASAKTLGPWGRAGWVASGKGQTGVNKTPASGQEQLAGDISQLDL